MSSVQKALRITKENQNLSYADQSEKYKRAPVNPIA